MRHVVKLGVVLAALVSVTGCAGGKGKGAATPPHISVAMDDQIERELLGEQYGIDVGGAAGGVTVASVGDEAVGTTTLTSAEIDMTPAGDATPATPTAGLPNERGSLSVLEAKRTWGVPMADDGIPSDRE